MLFRFLTKKDIIIPWLSCFLLFSVKIILNFLIRKLCSSLGEMPNAQGQKQNIDIVQNIKKGIAGTLYNNLYYDIEDDDTSNTKAVS